MKTSYSCRLCKKESLGNLCPVCEDKINRYLKENFDIDIQFKIGNPYYIIKKGFSGSINGLSLHKVIYLGPNYKYLSLIDDVDNLTEVSGFADPFISNEADTYSLFCRRSNDYLYRNANEIYNGEVAVSIECFDKFFGKYLKDYLKEFINTKLDCNDQINIFEYQEKLNDDKNINAIKDNVQTIKNNTAATNKSNTSTTRKIANKSTRNNTKRSNNKTSNNKTSNKGKKQIKSKNKESLLRQITRKIFKH